MNKKYIKMIENAYDTNLKDADLNAIENLVEDIIKELNAGSIRVAENKNGSWAVNQWVKKAILLSFKFRKNKIIDIYIRANEYNLLFIYYFFIKKYL